MNIWFFCVVSIAFVVLCIYGIRRTLKDVRVARSRPLLPPTLTKTWKKFFRKKKKTKKGTGKERGRGMKALPKGKKSSK